MDDNIDDLWKQSERSLQKTELILNGPCVHYSYRSPELNRHAFIYPSKLTGEQQEKLKQAEAILFELADEVEEETKTKTKRKAG